MDLVTAIGRVRNENTTNNNLIILSIGVAVLLFSSITINKIQ
jgi:hypothetical protein